MGHKKYKKKINDLNFIQSINVYSWRDTVMEVMERQVHNAGENEICASQRLASRICKEFLQLSKTTQF